ncbi:MAG: efflux RND transporter periplasmic adaptor subunit [Thermoanaerobaculia bacterium]
MTERSEAKNGTRRGKKLWRWMSLAVAVLLLVAGAVTLMNVSAARANGASTVEESSDASESAASTPEDTDDEKKGDEEGDDAKTPVPVEVASVEEGSVSAYTSSTANLVAENEVKVLSEVEGRVLTLRVEEGDWVKNGQVLATLVRDDQAIAFKKAQLQETNARAAYDRAKELVERELISREEFDKLSIDYEITQQELAEAEWALKKTTIIAPFSGRITARMTQLGQHVRPGDELFQVTDFDPLVARIYLPERDVLGLEEGQDVQIRLDAATEVYFAGRIRQISPVVDTSTGTVKVTVEATEPPEQVRPGSFVTVNIVRETHSDALLLPREAVLRELQKAHVYVAEDDVAEKRAVTLGLEEGKLIEVLSGVAAGDRVIVTGQGGLKDGSAVKILIADANVG